MSASINFPNHPAAEIFPVFSDLELLDLGRDIQAHGQREPIVLYKKQVLDGRNRKAACEALNIEPQFRELDDGDPNFDPVAFVLSANRLRRHLDTTKRALIAARVLGIEKANAKDRQRQGKEKLPDPSSAGQSRDKAGAMLGVSGRTVDQAVKLVSNGTPELIQLVERGEVSISAAAEVSESPPDSQVMAAKLGKHAVNSLAARRRSRKRRAKESGYSRPEPISRDERVEEWEALEETCAARRAVQDLFNDWYDDADKVIGNPDSADAEIKRTTREARQWRGLFCKVIQEWDDQRVAAREAVK